jgi:hypothetical protein
MIAGRAWAGRIGGTVALSVLALAASCKRSDTEAETTAATTAPSASQPPAPKVLPPADHLAPGELLEGSDRAFGVLLPQVMRVHESFVDAVYASGPTTVEALVPYFRAHLTGGDLHTSPFLATFDHVHAPPAPEGTAGQAKQDSSARELRVRIATSPDGARVDIRDTTPPVLPALPDEAARWRAAGLTPQGKVADPTHLD